MKNTTVLFLILLALPFVATGQVLNDPFNRTEIVFGLQKPSVARSSQIKSIQSLDLRSGVAYTSDSLFRTDDAGETWSEIGVLNSSSEEISAVLFTDENRGSVLVVNRKNLRLELAQTADGGNSWSRTPITLRNEDLAEADLENAALGSQGAGNLTLEFRLPTSSNFYGVIRYQSENGGESWEFVERSITPRTSDIAADMRSGGWSLTTEGNCEGSKSGCVLETNIVFNGKEITPPQIKELIRTEKENAKKEAAITPMFALVPGGSTRTSLNRGFDKCTNGSVAQMQTWWNTSHFYDANIYMSGRNRSCTQSLTAAWVDQVSTMGWGLIPTIVGYQAPCSVSTTSQKHSSDAAVAETQGRGEADIAITDANNIGLTTGTVLYYDMERYNDTGDGICSTAVKAFLKGWTDRVKERGYISGVYGSPTNAVGDWLNIPLASRMDAIWMARWDNVPSVWFYASPSPTIPTTAWSNRQRIKQWQAPHNETWGGVTFNIDGNIADGPVAGIAVNKNKNADFDGDGKSDVSVFRPDTGVWYVFNSSNSSVSVVGFGLATDIPTPGDYDGDGKTDYAVFRPSDNTWHMLTKAGFYSVRQFGAAGDIAAPSDFNGDGKTDIAVYRPSTGVWYVANSDSLGTFTIVQFGLTEDKPVQADYDGDGKTDIAVYRPSTGVWYVLRSSDGGFSAVAFGISTDLPAQGDYDGDGRADFVVLRDGTWYLLQSTSGIVIVQFGLAGDLPVTGDFDGDNKADISVYRPASGVWYLLQSLNGFGAIQFGVSTDRPIPNVYLPQ